MQWWLNTHRIREREKSNIFFWLDRDDNSAIWERLYLADGKDDERMSYTRYSLYIVDLVLLTRRIYIKKRKKLTYICVTLSLFLLLFFEALNALFKRTSTLNPLWFSFTYFFLSVLYSIYIYKSTREKKARRLNY
jgi:hypothetical protein